jgi:hypothetical protein
MKFDKRVYVALVVLIFIGQSCIKTNTPSGTSALNIVNVVNLSNPVITDFTPLNNKSLAESPLQYYASANQIGYGGFYESGSYVGDVSLAIFQDDDTASNIWSGQFNLAAGSVHTLFLAGDTTSVDTLFTTDIIPYYPSGDSASGLRFVNLVENGFPMAVDIQGNPPGQWEFNDLGYKQMSAFKAYAANSSIPGNYTFEIRSQASDSLLAVFTWSYTVYKNQTIVIGGTFSNSSYPITPFVINNF